MKAGLPSVLRKARSSDAVVDGPRPSVIGESFEDVRFRALERWDTPKSEILTISRSRVQRRLAGLMSRWMMPWWWTVRVAQVSPVPFRRPSQWLTILEAEDDLTKRLAGLFDRHQGSRGHRILPRNVAALHELEDCGRAGSSAEPACRIDSAKAAYS